jgi:hypothetical protein
MLLIVMVPLDLIHRPRPLSRAGAEEDVPDLDVGVAVEDGGDWLESAG